MSKKVLVVDDDISILDAISLILEDNDYDVQTAFKGDEAYLKASDFKPNVIILDVLLSGKDGREICKNLKSDEKTKKIPVIMVSAHPGARESTSEVGADYFLSKPFMPDDLLNAVSKFAN